MNNDRDIGFFEELVTSIYVAAGKVSLSCQSLVFAVCDKEYFPVPLECHHTDEGNFTTWTLAIAKYDFLRIWGSPKIELGEEAFSRQIPLFDRIYQEYGSHPYKHNV